MFENCTSLIMVLLKSDNVGFIKFFCLCEEGASQLFEGTHVLYSTDRFMNLIPWFIQWLHSPGSCFSFDLLSEYHKSDVTNHSYHMVQVPFEWRMVQHQQICIFFCVCFIGINSRLQHLQRIINYQKNTE